MGYKPVTDIKTWHSAPSTSVLQVPVKNGTVVFEPIKLFKRCPEAKPFV